MRQSCCLSQPKPKDDVATRKKTDAPSPDDPHAEEEEKKEPAAGESFVAAAEDEDTEGKVGLPGQPCLQPCAPNLVSLTIPISCP